MIHNTTSSYPITKLFKCFSHHCHRSISKSPSSDHFCCCCCCCCCAPCCWCLLLVLVLVVLSAGSDTLIGFGGGCDHITIQWYALSLSFCFIIVVLSFWLFFVRCFAIMMLRLKCLVRYYSSTWYKCSTIHCTTRLWCV